MAKKTDKDESKTPLLEHELLPVHELLSDENAAEVLKKYGIEDDQLPMIKKNDPALKVFNIKPKKGDIIRIRREDLTGKYDYYRVVI